MLSRTRMHSIASPGRRPPRGWGLWIVSALRALCWSSCCPETARTSRPGPLLCSTLAGASELRPRQGQTRTSGSLSRAIGWRRWQRAGAGGSLPCLPAEQLSRAGWWCSPPCKSHQGRCRVGRLHSGARGCRRAGPAMSSATSSRRRDMHNYALDQTLPCCYGTMVLIARAQGLARIKAAASARTARRARPITLRPGMRAVLAHYRRGDQGARNSSHSDALR
jgi:hypothetical protein